MFWLAMVAACFTVSWPDRNAPNIVLRMLPFSTLTQFTACGTNQLRSAAWSLTLWLSRFVALGMLPFAASAFSLAVLVKSAIHATASARFGLCAGTARSEPPRKPGIGLPGMWLGITNCLVTLV